MRRLIIAVLLATPFLATISGCMTYDIDHDRTILRYMESDIRDIHEDLDFIFYLDHESPLEIYMR